MNPNMYEFDFEYFVPSSFFTKKSWMLKLIKLTGTKYILNRFNGKELASKGFLFTIRSCMYSHALFNEYYKYDIKFKYSKLLYLLSIISDSRFIYFIDENKITTEMAIKAIDLDSISDDFYFPKKILKDDKYLKYALSKNFFYRKEFFNQIDNKVLFNKNILYTINNLLIGNRLRRRIAGFLYERIKNKKEFKKFSRFFPDITILEEADYSTKSYPYYLTKENVLYILKYLKRSNIDVYFFDFYSKLENNIKDDIRILKKFILIYPPIYSFFSNTNQLVPEVYNTLFEIKISNTDLDKIFLYTNIDFKDNYDFMNKALNLYKKLILNNSILKYYSSNQILKDYLLKNKSSIEILIKKNIDLELFFDSKDIKELIAVKPNILYHKKEYIYKYYNLSKEILLKNSNLTKKLALKKAITKDLMEELLEKNISYINYFNLYYKEMNYKELIDLYLRLKETTDSIKLEKLYHYFDKDELEGFLIMNIVDINNFKTPKIRKEIKKKLIDIYAV